MITAISLLSVLVLILIIKSVASDRKHAEFEEQTRLRLKQIHQTAATDVIDTYKSMDSRSDATKARLEALEAYLKIEFVEQHQINGVIPSHYRSTNVKKK